MNKKTGMVRTVVGPAYQFRIFFREILLKIFADMRNQIIVLIVFELSSELALLS